MSVLRNLLIAADQMINCLVKLSDGWGKPDEMLSSRAWRLRENHPTLKAVIDRIFFWDANHCQESFEIERSLRQFPANMFD